MRRNPAALPMPQTTECALTHRLPSNTTTTARPPADLPPPPVGEGRGGVLLHTANAKSPAVPLPPPWGRVGVEAAKKRAATKPHRTHSFTYTLSAQVYVKSTIGSALAHRLPSNTTIAASPRPRRSVGVVTEAANAKKQTSAHKQHLHPLPIFLVLRTSCSSPPLRASPCRGGSNCQHALTMVKAFC